MSVGFDGRPARPSGNGHGSACNRVGVTGQRRQCRSERVHSVGGLEELRCALEVSVGGDPSAGQAVADFAGIEHFTRALAEVGYAALRVRDISYRIAPSVAHIPFVTLKTMCRLCLKLSSLQ